MDNYKDFRIPYKGLQNGVHSYKFEVDASFFINFEKSRIREAEFVIKVDLDRRESMMVCDVNGSGFFCAPCDRCQVDIAVPVDFDCQIIFRFSEQEREEGDIIFINPKRDFLQFTDLIYDLVNVHAPMQNLRDCHSENYKYCDKEVLKRLHQDYEEDERRTRLWNELNKLEL